MRRNVDEFRDTASQIQQGMKFNCGFGFPEPCPGKEFQTKVYGGRIEGISRLFQLNTEIVVEIERPCYRNQYLGEVDLTGIFFLW